MKKIKSGSIFLLVTLFVVSSCSIEKRVHRSGYHISWKNSQSNHQKSDKEQLLVVDHVSQEENQDVEKMSKLKTKELRYETSKKELVPEGRTKIIAVNNESQSDNESNNIFINTFNDSETALVNEALETVNNPEVQFNSERSNTGNGTQDEVMFILLVLLCLIIPPLAVYLITEDLKLTLISLVLTILFWIPGVIFAFYILFTRY